MDQSVPSFSQIHREMYLDVEFQLLTSKDKTNQCRNRLVWLIFSKVTCIKRDWCVKKQINGEPLLERVKNT